MNTFLPYESFISSASCLDVKRLGKQRVEVYQILKALNGETKGWINHPAIKMWQNAEYSLIIYGLIVCLEWMKRGHKDTCYSKINKYSLIFNRSKRPSFLGNKEFHNSHKAALLAKNYEHYQQFGWRVKPRIKYVWPK